MVVGLVEPIDGFDLARLDPKNPPPKPWTLQPANPELLQALAEDFRDHNYSIQRVIKTIMKSNAYQLSTSFPGEFKGAYIPYYARRFVRVLTPVEAVDLVAQSTDTPFIINEVHNIVSNKNEKLEQAFSYVSQLYDPSTIKMQRTSNENNPIFAFMQAYYQAERTTPPVDKNVASPVQAMMMMTSPIVTKRITAEGTTRVGNLLKSGKTDDQIIEELFLATLSRRPKTQELDVAKRVIASDKKIGFEDIQWALLNTTEFLVNH
jgi:Protein of unknown function (DUF1553)